MKKYFFVLLLVFLINPSFAKASVLYSQSIELSPGWNIVSTPKVLESHNFSALETSNNFDIYALDASKTSGWATLSDLGQTEFTPLFGYFINNKTGVKQTLTFNYKNASISEQFFTRTFPKSGWYSFGIANSTYAKNLNSNDIDINNPDNILNSLIGSSVHYGDVVDFTDANYLTNINSVALANPWKNAIRSADISNNTEINSLTDFRETKGYAIYIKDPNVEYSGLQDSSIPQCSDGIDNDNDGTIDVLDSGCNSSSDNSEDMNDVKMLISKGSATPVAGNVEVSTSGSTSDILMLEVKLKNTGADMTFNSIQFNLTSDDSILSNILGQLVLKEGSTELANISSFATTTTQTVTFNLDNIYTINADETKYFRVYATIQDADNFTQGSGLTVSYVPKSANYKLTSTGVEFTAESGSAVGEKQSFSSQGVIVRFVSDSYTAPDAQASTQGTIALTFTVTAFGDNDIILNKDATNGSNAVAAVVTGASETGSLVSASGMTADAQGNFTVSAGDTKTFTISKKIDNVVGFVFLKINSVAGINVSDVTTRAF